MREITKFRYEIVIDSQQSFDTSELEQAVVSWHLKRTPLPVCEVIKLSKTKITHLDTSGPNEPVPFHGAKDQYLQDT